MVLNFGKFISPYIGLIDKTPSTNKKRIDITVKLKDAQFKDSLKDKNTPDYIALRNNMEDAVSYISDMCHISCNVLFVMLLFFDDMHCSVIHVYTINTFALHVLPKFLSAMVFSKGTITLQCSAA